MTAVATQPGAPRAATVTALDLSGFQGLSQLEAEARLRDEGPNELPTAKQRSTLRIALEVVKEPMFVMLVAAGALYLAMGEPADAAMLLSFVVVVMAITIVQERRTENALEALKDLSSPRALVIRDGAARRVAGREVARGDVLLLSEGDRVPADGLVRRAINLGCDESLLTGESVPVRKAPSEAATSLDPPGGDDLASVFSGTLVTAGQGLVEVLATGPKSQLGRIGKALQQLEPEPTPLQQETRRLVRTFAIVAVATCAAVVVTYALVRGGSAQVWKEGLLAGIAMAMATLPEEFPVVLTVFLALGAWRISKKQVLTRRMPAVETLGAATVLCVDKTGTLTCNQMTLRRLAAGGAEVDLKAHPGPLPEAFDELLEHAILASQKDPFDPMERALQAAGDAHLKGSGRLHPGWALARQYPLQPGLLAVSHVWHTGEGDEGAVSAKGAPEAIAELCRLAPAARQRLEAEVEALASQGLRVLAVARGRGRLDALPDEHRGLALELLGLLGLEDPLRPAVPAAVAECRAAGVRVVMVTGDYPATARSIARQAGLEGWDTVLTGPELERLDDAELARRVKEVQVYARVVPEQKLKLVQALKATGEVVAMTGDGVNDAPALKAAHIGVAMGGRGTDVAREAGALVLLDDDFSSIVAAVRLGRRIFDNIKKAIAFILAVHVPIAGLSVLPVFFKDWPLLLLPVHIVFLELIIDPACTLVFEAEEAEADVMRRPPRSPAERLFGARTVVVSLLQGLTVLAASLGAFLLARGHGPDAARALTFTTLVVAAVLIILVNRSWTRSLLAMMRVPNAAFRWVVGGALGMLALVLGVPALRHLFHFAPLHLDDLGLALGAGATCLVWFELWKAWQRRRQGSAAAGVST